MKFDFTTRQTSKVKISIIIISYNNYNDIFNCVRSIKTNIAEPKYELIVIDNASSEYNIYNLSKVFEDLKIIKNDINRGFAFACNQGAKISEGEYLLFVNSDVIVTSNPIPSMLKLYNSGKTGIVGAQLINSDGTLQPSYYNFPTVMKRILELSGLKKYLLKFYSTTRIRSEENFEVSVIKGAFMMIRKDLFSNLGMFDENYFMYIEDVDLSLQVKKLGYKNYIFNTSSIIHLGWHDENSQNTFVYMNRNIGLIYYYKKNHSKIYFICFLISSIVLLQIKKHYHRFIKRDLIESKLISNVLYYYYKGFDDK